MDTQVKSWQNAYLGIIKGEVENQNMKKIDYEKACSLLLIIANRLVHLVGIQKLWKNYNS